MIQLRNLNFDPDAFLTAMPLGGQPGGVRNFLNEITEKFPAIKLGSFTEKI